MKYESEIPQDLDWVGVRAGCTLSDMFRRLRDQIIGDIAIRNDRLKETPTAQLLQVNFTLKDSDTAAFIVWREGHACSSVSFVIVGPSLVVMDAKGAHFLEATIGISNEGRCMFRVDGADVEMWQLRKMALESLFFGFMS
jgi:hypothetical protein